MTNDDLAALILPWAKEHHTDKFEKTIAQVERPETYRKFLLRLVEIRAQAEPTWRNTLPLGILEETALTVEMRTKTGQTLLVGGIGALGRQFSFRLLELCKAADDPEAALQSMISAAEQFDLEIA